MGLYRSAPDHQETGWPKGVPYIIANEGCERFSFYGMKAILFVYLTQMLMAKGTLNALAERQATDVVHTFNAGVYALPMVGALIADRLWGKYSTILWLSLSYCAGHACLALFEDDFGGFVLGLMLIAVGAGGIKPCVSAHVGDQFGRGNWDKLTRVYQAFYFIINFGSMFSTLLIPYLKQHYGFSYAFALPGVLMAIATVWFWMGRKVFVHVPGRPGGKLGLIDVLCGMCLFMVIAAPMFGSGLVPAYAALAWFGKLFVSLAFLVLGLSVFQLRQRIAPDDGFLAVLLYSLRITVTKREQLSLVRENVRESEVTTLSDFWKPALRRFGREAAEGPPAVLRIVTVFAMVSVFWALFDQHSSSWIAQARDMDRHFTLFGWSFEVLPEQIQAINPALVMLLVPVTGGLLYPGIERFLHVRMTPLRRMTIGMFIASSSFAIVALAQQHLDAGEKVHVGWQLLAFLVLTLAEVMVSITGLEYAYTQAPRRMKTLIMGFWMLAVSFGNILVALLARFENLPRVQFFWTFAGLMLAAAFLFGVRAAFYRYQTYTQ
ncbi:MAG: transporter [Myxococcaceae bacterium]|nr:transporter [Myxococcaceae bacterium]